MKKRKNCPEKPYFEIFAKKISIDAGKAWIFLLAFMFVFFWLISGPIFKFSDTWQLIINSVSSISLLMVFIIQHTEKMKF